MKCRVFEKNLDEFIEDNLSLDLKNSMGRHVRTCDSCRKLYEQNIEIDNLFKEAICDEDIRFTGCREDVMKNIDRNKYSKNIGRRLYYHIVQRKGPYLSMAAIIIFMFVASPFILDSFKSYQSESAQLSAADNESNSENVKSNEDVKSSEDNVKAAEDIPRYTRDEFQDLNVFIPGFEKIDLVDFSGEPEFGTPWVKSPSKLYSASVDGKGETAIEEGVASIIIKETNGDKAWKFQLKESDKQNTPKVVEWWDDDNLLVIIGFAYGTVTVGGDLYVIDVHSGATKLVYKMPEPDENTTSKEIMAIEKEKNSLRLSVGIHDKDYMEVTDANWSIEDFDITLSRPMDILDEKGEIVDTTKIPLDK